MSGEPVSFVMTTLKPKLLQEMLKDSGFMKYFESTIKANELHMGGRTMNFKECDILESTLKKFSNVSPVVVQYYHGLISDSQQIHVYKKGKSVFAENFSYTQEQFSEVCASLKSSEKNIKA